MGFKTAIKNIVFKRGGFLLRLIPCVLTLTGFGCESKFEVFTSNSIKTSGSSISVKPIAAKPGEVVTITGIGFTVSEKNQVKITTTNGGEITAPVTVTSDTEATFVMPEGAGLGLTSIVLESDGKQMSEAISFVAELASNTLPIIIGDASEICSMMQYVDRNGDSQTGAKNCSGTSVDLSNLTSGNIKAGVTINGVTGIVTEAPPNCASDGATGCVTTASYKSADMTNVTAGNIKSGVTIAGQVGSVTGPPADCSANGQQSCVATGLYYAGSACSPDGANCFLPSYSVMSQPLKAINYSSIDQTKMLDSLTISGATGTVTSQGSWNLTTAFPGAGYYSGVSNAPVASTIFSGTTIAGVTGSATASPANCSSAGQQSCVATGAYYAGAACAANGSACYLPTYAVTTQPLKAISYDAINSSASSIRSGTTLGAVSGTLADCSSDGSTGCVTTSSYKSADMTNVTAGNIKSGVTIAGQSGNFPSATYPMAGATATADLDAATFDAKVKSASAFEYWDSAGSRQTGAGDDDIVDGNIKDQVSIFGTNGTHAGTGSSVNAWDLRAGVTVGAVTGKLKVNCRNRANLSIQDMGVGISVSGIAANVLTTAVAHGLASNQMVRLHYATAPTGANNFTTYYLIYASATTFQLSTTSGPGASISISGGAGITVHRWQDGTADIWDTIEDLNNGISGLPGTEVSGWSDNNCGGVESVAGDSNVWKDVTTSDGVTASSCGTTSINCTMQDKITGLWWSKRQTNAVWIAALSTCGSTLNATTYAGNTVAGFNGQTGWRLPTQKELLESYNHGIRSAASANWITEASMVATALWSASTNSSNSAIAWLLFLANGSTSQNPKSTTYGFVCVRP